MKTTTTVGLMLIALAIGLFFNQLAPGPGPAPSTPTTTTKPSVKVTAVTFVYEKDLHVVPGPVMAALDQLNRKRGIIASIYEKDVVDGKGEIPEQYKLARTAAIEAGLPALVILNDKTVIKVVKDPKTEQDVLEAVP